MSTFTKIAQWFKTVFAASSTMNSIDAYISSKNPTTPAEVDYWVRSYDRQSNRGSYL